MSWTTPAAIAAQVQKRWERGEILAASLRAAPLFPLELRLARPAPREITERFGEVQDWIRALEEGSRERRGFGYALRRETRRNRVQGSNAVPVAAIVPSETDALRLIRRQAEAERFRQLADTTLARFPALREWLTRRPLGVLAHAERWDRILAVLAWFAAHPRPGLYLRQLDIPGVDTKFIEAHRGLLAELLDEVLPASAVDHAASGVRGFARRYGLRAEPPRVRFRLLDPALTIRGRSDLSLPPEQFAALAPAARRVFITENRTNGLAFPACPASMVVFGLGYGLEPLAGIDWLARREVYYWGDIDTHGFGILERLRATLPQARSWLMDHDTLLAHRSLWGQEPADKRYRGDPIRLSAAERALFDALRQDRLGERVRLEQERIGYGWLRRALAALPDPPPADA